MRTQLCAPSFSAGRRVVGEILDVETRRGRVQLSLNALQEFRFGVRPAVTASAAPEIRTRPSAQAGLLVLGEGAAVSAQLTVTV
ncbi:hypothetical protein [Streptomyces sp. NPDC089799]|uniref:hypothetical protein n=1 Tax=Streptomyces sp. NPDC089799 TaxID=3155066 RepID=UPI00343786E5